MYAKTKIIDNLLQSELLALRQRESQEISNAARNLQRINRDYLIKKAINKPLADDLPAPPLYLTLQAQRQASAPYGIGAVVSRPDIRPRRDFDGNWHIPYIETVNAMQEASEALATLKDRGLTKHQEARPLIAPSDPDPNSYIRQIQEQLPDKPVQDGEAEAPVVPSRTFRPTTKYDIHTLPSDLINREETSAEASFDSQTEDMSQYESFSDESLEAPPEGIENLDEFMETLPAIPSQEEIENYTHDPIVQHDLEMGVLEINYGDNEDLVFCRACERTYPKGYISDHVMRDKHFRNRQEYLERLESQYQEAINRDRFNVDSYETRESRRRRRRGGAVKELNNDAKQTLIKLGSSFYNLLKSPHSTLTNNELKDLGEYIYIIANSDPPVEGSELAREVVSNLSQEHRLTLSNNRDYLQNLDPPSKGRDLWNSIALNLEEEIKAGLHEGGNIKRKKRTKKKPPVRKKSKPRKKRRTHMDIVSDNIEIILAGNDSPQLNNETRDLIDRLYKRRLFTKSEHQELINFLNNVHN